MLDQYECLSLVCRVYGPLKVVLLLSVIFAAPGYFPTKDYDEIEFEDDV